MTDFARILAPLANACEQKMGDAPFRAACEVCAETIGHDLFTIMRFDARTWEVARLYSSRPETYPVGGRKPKRATPWGLQVLGEGVPFLGSGESAIRWAFDDAGKILDLGLRHVMNMPIRTSGCTLGTLNLLRATPAFGEPDMARLRIVAGLLAGGVVHSGGLQDDTAPSC